jgi:heat shock protein HtpX
VIDDMSMNAFATGRNPENAVICVTKGLMTKLDKYELEAVLAHELSHIRNYDILLSTVVSVMVGFVVVIADFMTRRLFFRRRRSSNNNSGGAEAILVVISLIFIILSPLFMKMMQLFMSRKREYLADASAVEITRNPDAMISALAKISGDDDILEAANKSTAHMYFSAPVKKLGARRKRKSAFMSTHPLIEDRISALRKLN